MLFARCSLLVTFWLLLFTGYFLPVTRCFLLMACVCLLISSFVLITFHNFLMQLYSLCVDKFHAGITVLCCHQLKKHDDDKNFFSFHTSIKSKTEYRKQRHIQNLVKYLR